jgi:hypothetical protein
LLVFLGGLLSGGVWSNLFVVTPVADKQLSEGLVILEANSILSLNQVVDAFNFVASQLKEKSSEWDSKKWNNPDKSSSPDSAHCPSTVFSSLFKAPVVGVKLISPCDDEHNCNENWHDCLDSEDDENWDFLTGSDEHKN